MMPDVSLDAAAFAIVASTLCGCGIGAVFGYQLGIDIASNRCVRSIEALRRRIQTLNEALIWRNFLEDQQSETTFEHLMKARQSKMLTHRK